MVCPHQIVGGALGDVLAGMLETLLGKEIAVGLLSSMFRLSASYNALSGMRKLASPRV